MFKLFLSVLLITSLSPISLKAAENDKRACGFHLLTANTSPQSSNSEHTTFIIEGIKALDVLHEVILNAGMRGLSAGLLGAQILSEETENYIRSKAFKDDVAKLIQWLNSPDPSTRQLRVQSAYEILQNKLYFLGLELPKDRDDHIEDVIGRLHLNSPEWFWFRYALLKKYFSSDPDFEDFEHFEHSNNEETSLDFIDEYPNDGFLKVAFGPFGVEVDDELFVYLNVRNLLILYGKLEGTINIFAGQNQITGNSSP